MKREMTALAFGVHVAHKLRGYDRRTCTIVQHHINNILFEADMGKYLSETHITNNQCHGNQVLGRIVSMGHLLQMSLLTHHHHNLRLCLLLCINHFLLYYHTHSCQLMKKIQITCVVI